MTTDRLSAQKLVAITLSAMLVLSVVTVTPGVIDIAGAANQSADNQPTWPQDQYDDGRTGHTDNTTGPKGPVESDWTVTLTDGSSPYPVPPVVYDGRIYAGSDDGNVSAYHTSNGTHIWTSRNNSNHEIRSLTVANDTLYVSGSVPNGNSDVFALDRESGTERWGTSLGDVGTYSQIVVRNDGLYVTASGFDKGYLYAINATDGTRDWRFESDLRLWEGGVAYSNDTVYFGDGEDPSIGNSVGGIYAVNASSGSLRWSKSYDTTEATVKVRVRASPTVANGVVYVAKENGDLVAYDEETGTKQWNTTIQGVDIINSPAVADGVVYVGTQQSAEIHALDASTGNSVWSEPFEADGDVSSPIVVDGVVYAAGGAEAYGLYPSNGTERFSHSFGDTEPATPAVVNGTLYIREGGSDLHAIGDVTESANFGVTVTGTNSPVEEGQTLTVSADVTNNGAAQGQQDVTLTIDGVERDSQSVTLASGASQSLTLEWASVTGDAGDYTANVASDNSTDTVSVSVQAKEMENELDSFTVEVRDDPTVKDEALVVEFTNATTVGGEPFDGEINGTMSLGYPGGSLSSSYVTFDNGTGSYNILAINSSLWDDIKPGEYTDLVVEYERVDGSTVTDTYDVEIVTDELSSFNVTVQEDPTVKGDGLTVEMTNAVDGLGDPFEGEIDEMRFEYPGGAVNAVGGIDFVEGEETYQILAINSSLWDDVQPGEYTDLVVEYEQSDGTSINDTYDVEIVTDELSSFNVEVRDDPTVKGEGLTVEMTNATDGLGEPFEGEIDEMRFEHPGGFITANGGIEFVDGEESYNILAIDSTFWDDIEPGEYTDLVVEYEQADGTPINDTYDVEIVTDELSSFNVTVREDPTEKGDGLTVEMTNAVDGLGDPFEGEINEMRFEYPGGAVNAVGGIDFVEGEETYNILAINSSLWDDVQPGEYTDLVVEYEQVDGTLINDTYDVEIVAEGMLEDLDTFDVEVRDDPTEKGDGLFVEFKNATTVGGEPFDGEINGTMSLGYPGSSLSSSYVNFENGNGSYQILAIDSSFWDDIEPGEYTDLVVEYERVDGSTVSDTYDVEIVAEGMLEDLDTFDVEVRDDPTEKGDGLFVEFTNATTVGGEAFEGEITGSMSLGYPGSSLSSSYVTFENGNGSYQILAIDSSFWDDIEPGEYTDLVVEYEQADGTSINDTYDVEIVAEGMLEDLDTFDVEVRDDPTEKGDGLFVEFTNATTVGGQPFDGEIPGTMSLGYPGSSLSSSYVTFENGNGSYQILAIDSSFWDDIEPGEYTDLVVEYERVDGSTVTDTYDVEIINDDDSGDSSTESSTVSSTSSGDGDSTADIEVPSDVAALNVEIASIQMDESEDVYWVEFDDPASVKQIAFTEESLDGEVIVAELSGEPKETGKAPGSSVSVQLIDVPARAEDRSATLRIGIEAETLSQLGAEQDELRIWRFADGQWHGLDTEVIEVTDDEVIVEAETPGFSYFSVSAVSEPEAVISLDTDSIEPGEEVVLSAADSLDRFGEIVAYEWSLADQKLDGKTATVTLEEPGEYAVELTVTNDAGEKMAATEELVVEMNEESTTDPDEESSTMTSEEPFETITEEEPTTTAETPGFTIGLALIALLGAALLALRRRV